MGLSHIATGAERHMHAAGNCPRACCRASGCTRCSSALLPSLHFEEHPPEQRSGSCPSPDPVQRGMSDACGVTSGGRTAMRVGHGPSVHSCARTSPLSAHSPHLDHKEARQRGHTHHLAGVAVHLQQMARSRGSLGTAGGGGSWCSSPRVLPSATVTTTLIPSIGSTVRLQRSSCSARFTQSSHLGEAGQAVGAVDVHGTGAADALAARPPQAQRLVLQGEAGGRCASMWGVAWWCQYTDASTHAWPARGPPSGNHVHAGIARTRPACRPAHHLLILDLQQHVQQHGPTPTRR